MGSFNTTCSVSRSAICVGQKVKLFVLVNRGSYKGSMVGSMCYSEDGFSHIGFPMDAVYDDYGRYNIVQDDNSDYILNQIKKHYLMNKVAEGKTLDDYNEYHDYMEIPAEDLTWKTIQDMISSGRLNIQYGIYKNRKLNVNLMAVHKDVFDMMVPEVITYYDYDLKKDVSPTIQESVSKYEALLKYKVSKEIIKEKVEKKLSKKPVLIGLSKETKNELSFIPDDIELKGTYEVPEEHFDELRPWLYQLNLDIALDEMMEYGDKSKFEIKSQHLGFHGDFAKLFSDKYYAEKVVEMQRFYVSMVNHNIMFMPIMTSGQENDSGYQSNFLMKMAETVANLENSYYSDNEKSLFDIKGNISREIKWSELRNKLKKWENLDVIEMIEKKALYNLPEENLNVLVSYDQKKDPIGYELYDMILDDPKDISSQYITILMNK